MSFLLKWLRPGTSAKIALRPRRDVDLPVPFDEAYRRTLEAIEVTLGANVYLDDRAARTIEAGFGLVNNERVRVSFEPSETGTLARIEALFRAGATIPEKSAAVEALADTLIAPLREA